MTDIEINLTGSFPADVPQNIVSLENSLSSSQSGEIPANESGTVHIEGIDDGETAYIDKAVCTTGAGQPLPSGVDLVLVVFDNSGSYTVEDTLISGDGNTIHDGEVGSPLGSYENNTGSSETVGVVVENTNSSAVAVYSSISGKVTE